MNRFTLKLIACLSMLTDHICLVFFPRNEIAHFLRHSIGRISFPIFVFMLCQGFLYTRDRKKYGINLLLSSLVSEVFFDLAFHHKPFYWKGQNVVFTLLLSFLLLLLLEHFQSNVLLQFVFVLLFGGFAYLMHTDYSVYGIACCVLCYYTRFLQPYQSCAFSCIPLIIGYGSVGALLAVIPLFFYNKTGGRFSAPVKFAFYAFYPGHLALIALVYKLLR